MAIRQFPGVDAVPDATDGAVVAIGNFDGVHRGHREVICRAVRHAAAIGARPVVLTFDPHPSEVLGGGERVVLTSAERKAELIERLAPEAWLVVQRFDRELAATSAEDFAAKLLAGRLCARRVVVGANFRFGRKRAGTVEVLAELGARLGFSVEPVALATSADEVVSSSRVRDRLLAAELGAVRELLGRPHSTSGVVVAGDQRGRKLGFPTANLGAMSESAPPHGVYACLVDRLDADGRAARLSGGVANVGTRPTVGAGYSVEVHLLEFLGDLYGQRLRVHWIERLRGEQRFGSLDELVDQIGRDTAAARERLAAEVPAADARAGWF